MITEIDIGLHSEFTSQNKCLVRGNAAYVIRVCVIVIILSLKRYIHEKDNNEHAYFYGYAKLSSYDKPCIFFANSSNCDTNDTFELIISISKEIGNSS